MFAMNHPHGSVEVIVGPMFSGKSEELIRRLKRASLARQRVVVFKPQIDHRYHPEDIVSHSQQRFPAIPIQHAKDILEQLEIGTQVIGIDEAQFLGPEIVEICENLAERGLRIVVAGLDLDFRGMPFEPMPKLLAIAESVTKLSAICMRCGAPATRSQRLIHEQEQVLVGASESYEARCRFCFEKPTNHENKESVL